MTDHLRNMKIGKLSAFPIETIGDNSEQRILQARHGGKIILPSFVLRRVCRTDQTLMIFKLINDQSDKHAFCGVFAFDGEEHKVAVPLWIIKQLQIELGQKVSVELVTQSIPKGLFAKFEPMTRSFLEITDPKAVLEYCLRSYVCISREDIISIYYNRNIYELRICETLPSDTIVINECDLTVDFQEMQSQKEIIKLPEECDLDQIQAQNATKLFEAFSGAGQSTGGATVSADSDDTNRNVGPNYNQSPIRRKLGTPDYDYRVGSIFFKRYNSDLTTTDPNSQAGQHNKANDQQMRKALRRPVTRSLTQQYRSEANPSQTDSIDSMPSNNKKRKKNCENKKN